MRPRAGARVRQFEFVREGAACAKFRSDPLSPSHTTAAKEPEVIASHAPTGDSTATGPGPKVTRRNFIVWYLAGLLTALVVAAVAPLLVFIWPSGAKVKNADVSVSLSKPLDDLADGETLQFNAPANYGFRMVDGGGDNYPGKVTFGAYAIKNAGKLIVLSLTCSHLGCSVSWTDAKKQFDCPCHGSIFNITGDVVHGPAIAPLSHLSWQNGSKPTEIKVQGYSLQGVG